jgi:hypothetical protein
MLMPGGTDAKALGKESVFVLGVANFNARSLEGSRSAGVARGEDWLGPLGDPFGLAELAPPEDVLIRDSLPRLLQRRMIHSKKDWTDWQIG